MHGGGLGVFFGLAGLLLVRGCQEAALVGTDDLMGSNRRMLEEGAGSTADELAEYFKCKAGQPEASRVHFVMAHYAEGYESIVDSLKPLPKKVPHLAGGCLFIYTTCPEPTCAAVSAVHQSKIMGEGWLAETCANGGKLCLLCIWQQGSPMD